MRHEAIVLIHDTNPFHDPLVMLCLEVFVVCFVGFVLCGLWMYRRNR